MKKTPDTTIEIIAVGSELLTPNFLDTNSLHLTRRLNDLGLEVSFKSIVGDDKESLISSIETALERARIIIAMGGLGPTQDDRTREIFAEVLKINLFLDSVILQSIEKRFSQRSLIMPPVNKKQAYIFEGAEVLQNKNGTAPGQYLKTDKNIIILLPGPPHEIIPMFEESIIPRLEPYRNKFLARKILKITGLTESKVETLISDLYPIDSHIGLNILARPGQIEIHLKSSSNNNIDHALNKLEHFAKNLIQILQDHVFSQDGKDLEEYIGTFLQMHHKTIAVAESCTGGFLGHRITNVPGSSDYFLGGEIVYSNESKINSLNVSKDLVEEFGAVSSEVATAMAEGIKTKTGSDYGLSITGIAGPSGGTQEKPVGLVYVALAGPFSTEVIKNLFMGNRENIKFQASQKALDMLRKQLEKQIPLSAGEESK